MLGKILRILSNKRTIDILCEALISLVKDTASQVRVLENLCRETLGGYSELEEKREELAEQHEILMGLLKYTSDFFKEVLFQKDFELMDMEVPDYLSGLSSPREEEDKIQECEGADIIEFDSIRNKK